MTPDPRRTKIRHTLVTLLSDAIGPNKTLSVEELHNLGLPLQFVPAIAAESRDVNSQDEADALADKWTRRILEHLDEQDATPAEIAKKVPRL